MRLRNWLLTGTSVAVLALAPVSAVKAQSAELLAAYQAYATARDSGDGGAANAALPPLTELCIVEGYASLDECIAALDAMAAAGTPAEQPAEQPVDADAAAQAAAEAEAQAAAEAEAQAAAEAEAQAAAEAEAQAAAEAEAQAAAEAEAQAAAEAEAQAAAEAEAQAAAEAEARAAAEAEAQAAAEAEAQAAAEAEAQAAADAEAQAAAEAEAQAAADAEAQAAGEAQFVADLNAALAQYQEALNIASTGDLATAQPMASDAEARILELCTANGYADIASCIGQDLPPLPEASAEQPASDGTASDQPAAEDPAAEQPAAEQPATEDTGSDQPAADDPAAEQPAETDPLVEAQAELQIAVELYVVGVGQIEAGDVDGGNATLEAANSQINEICTDLGFTDATECLTSFGFSLPPVPEAPEQPAAEEEPEELSGSDEAVTPETSEAVPEDVAAEDAAPVLDSAKDADAAPPAEEQPTDGQPTDGEPAAEQPAEQPAEEPAEPAAEAAPPPEDDSAAQSEVTPFTVVPVSDVQGEQITADALPAVEVRDNVTVVNNITNQTNITNETNNFTNTGFIFQVGVNLVISNPAQERDRFYDEDEDEVFYERLGGGRVKETIVRPNGVQIVTVRNRYGEVIRRSRIMPDGREYILAYYDEDSFEDDGDRLDWRDPGDDLPPLRLTIPVREYILDADEADEEEVELFLAEPPVERVQRIYTIDEVKRSARVRDMVRRLEVGSLTFDTGAATIPRSQVGALSKVANAMLELLERNPAETFLIEGHTDAVGSEISNLVLSDARASTVAGILTRFYDVPPENLVTQGYGERYLKVRTEDDERLNRRVTVKRITPLITVASRD